MKYISLLAVLLAAPAVAQTTQSSSFNFVLPWNDPAAADEVTPAFTDVSALNPSLTSANFPRVSVQDGHFYDSNGKRVRFLGCNFSFGANFPTNDEATKIAAHLRKYGFNMVRLHHMDRGNTAEGIFDPAYPGDTQHLNPVQLQRLDFLVSEFKKNGIYVDLNLKVSRTFTQAELGIDTSTYSQLPRYHKVVSWFDPRMIQLQKDYASQLLGRKNQSTGIHYTQDPVVALIEVINEDSLLGEAQAGELTNLPPYYLSSQSNHDSLHSKWNRWLVIKYHNTGSMLDKWNTPGTNLIENSTFKNGTTSWYLEQTGGAVASMATEATDNPEKDAVKVTVTAGGNVKLHPRSLNLEPGVYTLSFEAKSSVARTMAVNSSLNQTPWTRTGLDKECTVSPGPTWKRYTIVFNLTSTPSATGTTEVNRLSFVLGNSLDTVWIRDVSFRSGADYTPMGSNLIENSTFKDKTNKWLLESPNPAVASMATEATDNPEKDAVKVTVTAGGNVKLHPRSLNLEPGVYTLSFEAKSSVARTMKVYSDTGDPSWLRTGLDKDFSITPGSWKRYTTVFNINKTSLAIGPTELNRISFVLGNNLDTVWIRDVSFRSGAAYGLEDTSYDILTNTYPLPKIDSVLKPGRDLTAFLMDVEQEYMVTMRSHIKDIVGAQGAITFSQAAYGGIGGLARESGSDFVDMHAYWDHPLFPSGTYDNTNWTMHNTSMVQDSDGGLFPALAMHRVAGKPFTVSEYNHCFPNDFQAEGLPMVAAYASMQDWDGVFLFDYHSSSRNWNSTDIGKNFFGVDNNPSKLAFMPAAARIFRRGDVSPATNVVTLNVPSLKKQEPAQDFPRPREKGTIEFWNAQGVTKLHALTSILKADFESTASKVGISGSTSGIYTPIKWDPIKGLFLLNSPQSKAIIGFVGEATVPIIVGGSDTFQVTKMDNTPRFMTMTLNTVGAANNTKDATALLLTVCGKVQNPGMTWNGTTAGWGTTGSPQIESLSAKVSISTDMTSAEVWALDGTGAHKSRITPSLNSGKLTFNITPGDNTLWYEIRGSKSSSTTSTSTN